MIKIGKCGDCKFWAKVPAFYSGSLRACLRDDLLASPGCEGGDIFLEGSGIATEHNFGCIQWESADQTTDDD